MWICWRYHRFLKCEEICDKLYVDIIISKDGLYTVRIYFKKAEGGFKPLDNLVNLWRFFISHRKGFRIIRKARRKEDIVHVHVLTRLGVVAWFNKIMNGI